jgi:hypothetical protein
MPNIQGNLHFSLIEKYLLYLMHHGHNKHVLYFVELELFHYVQQQHVKLMLMISRILHMIIILISILIDHYYHVIVLLNNVHHQHQ